MSEQHLSDETLARLIEQRLEPAELAVIHLHIDCCTDCQQLVAAVAGSYFFERPLAAPAASAGPTVAEPAVDPIETSNGGLIPPWQPPKQFDEFKIVGPLGQGAMGQVFLAEDTLLDRTVAIKFIASLEPSAALRDRFRLEAKAIARLTHPNVVAIYRVGEVEGRPYLVSEFVQGTSLDHIKKPIPWQRALTIGIELVRGLSTAHRRGVLHRDIKPANVILGEDGQVKLLDFGLAKLLDSQAAEVEKPPQPGLEFHRSSALLSATSQLSDHGAIMGTPLYLAPELWLGRPSSPRSDLYAIGALLYELCTGRLLHQASTLDELRRLTTSRDPEPLAVVVPQVDERFAEAVDRCLRREPEKRPASAEELLQSLLKIDDAQPQNTKSPRRRTVAAALLGLVLCVSAVTAYAPLRRKKVPADNELASTQSPSELPASVLVPGGSFNMGSESYELASALYWCDAMDKEHCPGELFKREQPRRRVQISPFWMDTTEVTNEQFVLWLNQLADLHIEHGPEDQTWVWAGTARILNMDSAGGMPHGIEHQKGLFSTLPALKRKPARLMTWPAAQRYCEEQGKRLPTEAEWEFAARGSEGRRFPWGATEPRCDGVAFARLKGMACERFQTDPLADVGTSKQDRTPLGIYDLGGNVSEWVADRFVDRYPDCPQPCLDPYVPESEDTHPIMRVLRGGSYSQIVSLLRSAGRARLPQSDVFQDLGFRCVKSDSR